MSVQYKQKKDGLITILFVLVHMYRFPFYRCMRLLVLGMPYIGIHSIDRVRSMFLLVSYKAYV